jgi:hypothetical protein
LLRKYNYYLNLEKVEREVRLGEMAFPLGVEVLERVELTRKYGKFTFEDRSTSFSLL